MKIEAVTVKELFASIKYFTEAINETINVGHDDLGNAIKILTEEIDKTIDTFEVMNLQELTKVNKEKRHDYLKHYEKCTTPGFDLANANQTMLYKAHLYLHIKKTIRNEIKAEDLAAVPNDELYNWIEGNTIFNDSPFMKSAVSNEYFRASINVVRDVCDEIIEQRKKAPQQKLF